MKVSIVIPNWNGKNLLEKNLPSILKAKTNPKNQISEIIIVDDGSTDDSVKFLSKNFKNHIKLIKHTKNRGFSSAVNTGVRMAKGELVCLLNIDVTPSENFLISVIPHFNKDKLLFGVSLSEKGYGYAKGFFKNGFIEHAPGMDKKVATDTFWVNGGSSVVNRKIWMRLKGFDEELYNPFYWEDVDIGYRAAKKGYHLLWEPKAKVLHKHESVINPDNFKVRYLDIVKERNQLLLIWKNVTSRNLTRKHLLGLFKRASRHPGYLKVIFAALKKYPQVRKKRIIEKRESKVSDEAVFNRFN